MQVAACASTIQHHLQSKARFVAAANWLRDADENRERAGMCSRLQEELLRQLLKLGDDAATAGAAAGADPHNEPITDGVSCCADLICTAWYQVSLIALIAHCIGGVGRLCCHRGWGIQQASETMS